MNVYRRVPFCLAEFFENLSKNDFPADLFDRLSDVIEKAVTALLNEPVIVETTKLKTNIDLESEED